MVLASTRNLLNQWFPPKPGFTEADVPSQKGKVFIVTGGNGAVGYALIKILYHTGATIYMASRSKEKAEKAIAALTSESPPPETPGQIKFLHLDLNDLLSVKASAATFASQESKLNVLWNNAGTGITSFEIGDRTAQDFELLVGQNCIATLLFTTLLLPQLRAAVTPEEPARVVWTASFLAEGGTPTNGIDFSLLEKGTEDKMKNYAISKAGTWMLGREFARRYGKAGIVSVVQNPGNLKNEGWKKVDALTMFFIKHVLHEPRFGAYTELYAGLSRDIGLKNNGAYVIPWGRVRGDEGCPRKDILNAMLPEDEGGLGYATKLWEWCEMKWKPFI
ncbi:putative oxidoreductase,short chain dehydrogenase [Stipitochalara longipes BDJ]|nr:putative oxidoreductase,short chain dehydrogenase [Stipitochalara longipes BDJ]